MKIVIMEGFGSSAFFQPSAQEYMGRGTEAEAEIAEADVVIATWPPDERPIVLKAPEGVEIVGAVWGHMRGPIMQPSVTAQQMDEDIYARGREMDSRPDFTDPWEP